MHDFSDDLERFVGVYSDPNSDGGRGMLLNHDVEGAVSPLENKGPLPEGWGECQDRPRR